MGQKVSVSNDEENELFNLFKLRQHERKPKTPEKSIVLLMQMMAPKAFTFKDRLNETTSKIQCVPAK
ncbi:hypothetical protein I4U23_028392 [Adineta vaga]|nr:hypothetical protein I4U23_028392 [Adineta vaga]